MEIAHKRGAPELACRGTYRAKGPRMAKSVEDRGRGARMARRDEGVYLQYVTEERRSQPGWIGREIDRLSHSRALRANADRLARKGSE